MRQLKQSTWALLVLMLSLLLGCMPQARPEQDISKIRKTAGQGDVAAQLRLGTMFEFGLGGLPQDYTQAFYWYQIAAEQGSAMAQNQLGLWYANGQGVQQNNKLAFDWTKKAAEQGVAGALSRLGNMYNEGNGVAQDDTQAVEWLQKAAKQGNAEAQLHLGRKYANGKGVAQDDKQAAVWIRKAAEQGLVMAQCNLGVMYFLGRGVPQDYKQAVDWYRKAAEQGDTDAQFFLVAMYDKGEGAPQNEVTAYAFAGLDTPMAEKIAVSNSATIAHNTSLKKPSQALASEPVLQANLAQPATRSAPGQAWPSSSQPTIASQTELRAWLQGIKPAAGGK